MRILISGVNGQLGNEMRDVLSKKNHIETLFTDVAELDICDTQAVDTLVEQFRPKYIINCAAYTAVDRAEDDKAFAQRLNCDAVQNLAIAATKNAAKIVHISTDYVFDGKGTTPYTEDMPTDPQSVYGLTKLAGENILQKICPDSIIIRTAWLYSPFGNNFVKTMLRIGRERGEVSVVADQVGTPTYANDLARAIVHIVEGEQFVPGIYHYSNDGVCSWYDFAVAIFEESGVSCKVNAIGTADYPTKAVRPHYSVLDKGKIKAVYGVEVPHWRESLVACLNRMQ